MATPTTQRSVPSIDVQSPDPKWLESYLHPQLTAAKAYSIPTPDVAVKLDQNESPWDWPEDLKAEVCSKLQAAPWNRYPSAYADDLAAKVGAYIGVGGENVLLTPGSNYLIALMISMFGRHRTGKTVIAEPSFALYASHCRYEGLDFEAWSLNADLEYDVELLPALPEGSLVIFASPNNPVGNVLGIEQFEELLKKHPKTLFFADEAYYEYSKTPYTELLGKYSNLIMLRTFSKTLGAAGLRLGYAVGAKAYIDELRKLRSPFLLNRFTLAAAHTVLDKPAYLESFHQAVQRVMDERQRVLQALQSFAADQSSWKFSVKDSEANFLLMRFADQAQAEAFDRGLVEQGVLIRNVSQGPGLAGCLRVTMGTAQENDRFLEAVRAVLA